MKNRQVQSICAASALYMNENKILKWLERKLGGLDEILTQLNRCIYVIMNLFLVCMNLSFFLKSVLYWYPMYHILISFFLPRVKM